MLLPLSFILVGIIVLGLIVLLITGSFGGRLTLSRVKLKEKEKEIEELKEELLMLAYSFETNPSYTRMEAYELELDAIKSKLLQLAK